MFSFSISLKLVHTHTHIKPGTKIWNPLGGSTRIVFITRSTLKDDARQDSIKVTKLDKSN